ncbi:MAG: ferritin-like domain-containing protein [Candidatus Thioglobus sp.]|nr:MAG: ferritin-like domain-containing protein [Candidatus Thioglobus sp.]
MAETNVFALAHKALMSAQIDEKIALTHNLHALNLSQKLDYNQEFAVEKILNPGRPNKPKLAKFADMPARDNSDIGFIASIHAICHIEFNAINLALDAVYRFQNMPDKFYQDWIKVAFEESKHFSMLNNYLLELGYQYGDFAGHNGLWKMTTDTDYDVLARMALVPRVLEAKGLDATPKIQKRFRSSKFSKMVGILDVIFADEIGHVKIGNSWFHYLCQQRNIEPLTTFDALVQKHIGSNLRGPFNIEARKLADFSAQELDYLQNI